MNDTAKRKRRAAPDQKETIKQRAKQRPVKKPEVKQPHITQPAAKHAGNQDQQPLHRAFISLGSNINPAENIRRAVALLREHAEILALSACYETSAVGSDGPNFLNMTVILLTGLDIAGLKTQVLGPIENRLGRVRTEDKNAPRTIDLDIVVFDEQVIDEDLWRRVHLALPLSELLPDLKHPESQQPLREVARRLLEQDAVIPRPELNFSG